MSNEHPCRYSVGQSICYRTCQLAWCSTISAWRNRADIVSERVPLYAWLVSVSIPMLEDFFIIEATFVIFTPVDKCLSVPGEVQHGYPCCQRFSAVLLELPHVVVINTHPHLVLVGYYKRSGV